MRENERERKGRARASNNQHPIIFQKGSYAFFLWELPPVILQRGHKNSRDEQDDKRLPGKSRSRDLSPFFIDKFTTRPAFNAKARAEGETRESSFKWAICVFGKF